MNIRIVYVTNTGVTVSNYPIGVSDADFDNDEMVTCCKHCDAAVETDNQGLTVCPMGCGTEVDTYEITRKEYES